MNNTKNFNIFFDNLQYIPLIRKRQSMDISQTNRSHRGWEIVHTKRKRRTRLNCVLCCFISSSVSTSFNPKNKQETKDFSNSQISETREEIAHWWLAVWSRIESIQIFESLSTMIFLHFSPLARCSAHKIASASAAIETSLA